MNARPAGFSVLLVAIAAAASSSAADEVRRSSADGGQFVGLIDPWIRGALERLQVVPAMALAVVVDDQVVLATAWGVADITTGEPADADTQFYIASMTKSFTALMSNILHTRADIDLDSSFASHLDGVEVEASLRADEVKLRDFLTHTSGVANGPITYRLAYTGEHDPETLRRLLGDCTPATSAPLGMYQYTNAGYNILGIILDRETGKTWQEHLRDEIFAPLGMERTSAYASLRRKNGWTVAAPHFALDPNGVRRLTLEKQDNTMQSAGGLMTTARDMARWLRFQLRQGKLDGRQLVDAAVVAETQQVLVETSGSSVSPFEQHGYGLGWAHGTHRGQRVLSHGGGYPGFQSLMSFMPDADIAVAGMVNEATVGAGLLRAAVTASYDWWLDAEVDLEGAVTQLVMDRDSGLARYAASLRERADREWMLSRPRAEYTGTFVHELYGTLRVEDRDGVFHVSAGNLHCDASPYPKAETMRVELIPLSGMVIAFEDDDEPVEGLRLDSDWYERVD